MMTDLLPCPFCGGAVKMVTWPERAPDVYRYFPWCQRCDIVGPNRHSETEACKVWNTRPRERELQRSEDI